MRKFRNIVTGQTAVLTERDPQRDISVCILTEDGERRWIMSSDFRARWKEVKRSQPAR
jgi:hypothetical protein